VPEIELPAGFDRAAIDEWIAKIATSASPP